MTTIDPTPRDVRTPAAKRVDRIMEEATGRDLSSWEKFEFLPSVKNFFVLSEKQETRLREIEDRLLIEREE